MRSWKKPTPETVERVLSSFEKETDRQYFFSRLNNPRWIQPLAERGCFGNPPNIRHLPDGYVQCPFWPELEYLKNICKDAPSEIVENIIQIVLELPPVENPIVYEEIVEMALYLDGLRSARLKSKVLEFARLDRQFRESIYPRLLGKWTAEGQTDAALELASILVKFDPDPKAEEKKKKYNEIGRNQSENHKDNVTLMMTTMLEPVARYSSIYVELLDEGIRPLVESEPYKVALMLIDATDTMISLGKHEDELASDTSTDFMEIWCRRLTKPRRDFPNLQETLVNTLTCACEYVWNRSRDLFGDLDAALRDQRWDVFKRIRQHLYGLNPSEHTRPLIREFILTHDNYSKTHYGYEFQQMVRMACEYFGAELLTVKERTRIFNAILGGPPKEIYREFMGEHFTDSKFEREKKTFHHRQLRPFARVLFGRYSDYFEELQASNPADELTDESYSPVNKSVGGTVRSRSPKSHQEIANLTDQELLDYINRWDNEHQDRGDWLIAITIDDLAGAFRIVFRDHIIPSDVRLNFWIENRDNIRRPIYVRSIVEVMKDNVKAKNFDKLDEWFAFCRWVLTNPDPEDEEANRFGRVGDESSKSPNWRHSRRAVCDFVEDCIRLGIDLPFSFRGKLSELLEMLCTQYDSVLDNDNPVLLDRDDQFAEAINTTRGSAVNKLVNFGLWVLRHDDGADVSEVTAILEQRLGAESNYPLTLPEYAVLGRQFGSLFHLDEQWAVSRKSRLFPQNDFTAWREAFGSYLKRNHLNIPMFEVLRDDFEFALEHLDCLKQGEWTGVNSAFEYLGQHLFKCYIWDLYPLRGELSLLNRFYKESSNERAIWARLFGQVGFLLRNTGKQLDPVLVDRIATYFEWRLEVGEPTELKEFVYWLEAECIDGEWRLSAYSRILDLFEKENWDQWKDQTARLPSRAMHSIGKMIPAYTTGAIDCLAKLIESMPTRGVYYIPTEDAKTILGAGRDHDDETVRKKADEIRENMLKRGFLSVKD